MDGKIDIENDKIRIQPIYEVSGDANLTTGSIDFTGDIVIHGQCGIRVTGSRQTGSITIDGKTEACNLEAGKDIIFKKWNGRREQGTCQNQRKMQSLIYTVIQVEGDMEADVLLNRSCVQRIYSDPGQTAKIIGGMSAQSRESRQPRLEMTQRCGQL